MRPSYNRHVVRRCRPQTRRNCRCHVLCESLLGPAGCAESVTLSGAEAEQPTRMGTYSRVPGRLYPAALGRPVYQRVGYGSTVYLWYQAEGGNWWTSNSVGSLRQEDRAVVSSFGGNEASCPQQDPAWHVFSTSANGWLSPHPTLRIRVADAGARIRSRPPAALSACGSAPNSLGFTCDAWAARTRHAHKCQRMSRARGLCRCVFFRCCEWPRLARCHACCRGRCHDRHGSEHAVAVELRESLRTRRDNVHARGRLCR